MPRQRTTRSPGVDADLAGEHDPLSPAGLRCLQEHLASVALGQPERSAELTAAVECVAALLGPAPTQAPGALAPGAAPKPKLGLLDRLALGASSMFQSVLGSAREALAGQAPRAAGQADGGTPNQQERERRRETRHAAEALLAPLCVPHGRLCTPTAPQRPLVVVLAVAVVVTVLAVGAGNLGLAMAGRWWGLGEQRHTQGPQVPDWPGARCQPRRRGEPLAASLLARYLGHQEQKRSPTEEAPHCNEVHISVDSAPECVSGAVVRIDGRRLGHDRWDGPLPPGKYRLSAVQAAARCAGRTVLEVGPDTAPVSASIPLRRLWQPPWVALPTGTFHMGSNTGGPNERPAHLVHVPAFEMQQAEVTVEMYGACVDAGACTAQNTPAHATCASAQKGPERHPISCVTWGQAQAFARWFGEGARLCSEAEWEYAARAAGRGSRPYPWGKAPPRCKRAVFAGQRGRRCGHTGPQPVCSKAAGSSPQGICDLLGNVSEWLADSYGAGYADAPTDGSAQTSSVAGQRSVRGGSWASAAKELGGTRRDSRWPGVSSHHVGIRLCRSVPRSTPTTTPATSR